MLNIQSQCVTRGEDDEAITLVFYPDTGCLRFADAFGFFHELRPPHSWIAISSASRGVRRGTYAMTEVLNTLLFEFCAKRPRWLSSVARVSVPVTAAFRASIHTDARALDEAPARAALRTAVAPFGAGLPT